MIKYSNYPAHAKHRQNGSHSDSYQMSCQKQTETGCNTNKFSQPLIGEVPRPVLVFSVSPKARIRSPATYRIPRYTRHCLIIIPHSLINLLSWPQALHKKWKSFQIFLI